MKTYTATELRQKSAEILEEAQQGPVQVTQRNLPMAAVVSWEDYERLTDTIEVILNPETFASVKEGMFQFYDGRMRDWEEEENGKGKRENEKGKGEKGKRLKGAGGRGYRVMMTEQADGDFERIPSIVAKEQVGRWIGELAREPESGRSATYLRGLRILRASQAHYLIVYRVEKTERLVAVLGIVLEEREGFGWMGPRLGKRELGRQKRNF